VEAAAGGGHLAPEIVEDVAHDAGEVGPLRDLPRGEVQRRQLRVVVEHLLEVRHLPGGVRRVAVEAAAHLVVDAARRHLLERADHHLARAGARRATLVVEQEVELGWARELRRAPEAAVRLVERRGEPLERGVQDRRGRERGARRRECELPHPHRELARVLREAQRLGVERLPELRSVSRNSFGEVRRAGERLAARREPHGHRPAAAPREHLDDGHEGVVRSVAPRGRP
jgi:hypothetical protein